MFILNKNVSVYAHLTDNPAIHDKFAIRDRDAGEYLDNPHIHGTALNLNTKVQYILTDYTSREELLKSFDYKHCTISYVPKEMKLYITRGAFDAIRNKQLVVNNDQPQKKWRYDKFVKRGWRTGHAFDHHKGLLDSYQSLIQQSVNDMMRNINRQKGMLPTLDEKDIDIEAFKALVK